MGRVGKSKKVGVNGESRARENVGRGGVSREWGVSRELGVGRVGEECEEQVE